MTNQPIHSISTDLLARVSGGFTRTEGSPVVSAAYANRTPAQAGADFYNHLLKSLK
jgi:hypothetical protein